VLATGACAAFVVVLMLAHDKYLTFSSLLMFDVDL
jgi:hypothetical protein